MARNKWWGGRSAQILAYASWSDKNDLLPLEQARTFFDTSVEVVFMVWDVSRIAIIGVGEKLEMDWRISKCTTILDADVWQYNFVNPNQSE